MPRILDSTPAGVSGLAAATGGAAQITRILAHVVDQIILAVPTALRPGRFGGAAPDLVADLRALRGCLTTGAALVDSSIEHLRRLADSSPIRVTADEVDGGGDGSAAERDGFGHRPADEHGEG